jgi:hypothetical protein
VKEWKDRLKRRRIKIRDQDYELKEDPCKPIDKYPLKIPNALRNRYPSALKFATSSYFLICVYRIAAILGKAAKGIICVLRRYLGPLRGKDGPKKCVQERALFFRSTLDVRGAIRTTIPQMHEHMPPLFSSNKPDQKSRYQIS